MATPFVPNLIQDARLVPNPGLIFGDARLVPNLGLIFGDARLVPNLGLIFGRDTYIHTYIPYMGPGPGSRARAHVRYVCVYVSYVRYLTLGILR